MAKCDLCGKLPQFGHNIPKSQHRTKRQWKPNIQRVTVMMEGQPRRMNLCVRCLRTMHKT
jgi:large subunit ribosomal protein L28